MQDFNIQSLFNCSAFGLIYGSGCAWKSEIHSVAGKEKQLPDGVDFKECLDSLQDYMTTAQSTAPIIVTKSLNSVIPSFALLGSGEIQTFVNGHYISPAREDALTTILKSYIKDYDNTKYKLNYVFSEVEDESARVHPSENNRVIFGTDGHYTLRIGYDGTTIYKAIPGELNKYCNLKGLKGAIAVALHDRRKSGSNYPIFLTPYTDKGRAPLVILSDGSLYRYFDGFYAVPSEETLSELTAKLLEQRAEDLISEL